VGLDLDAIVYLVAIIGGVLYIYYNRCMEGERTSAGDGNSSGNHYCLAT